MRIEFKLDQDKGNSARLTMWQLYGEKSDIYTPIKTRL